ncbi:MAG TPA: SAM-dependent methyltransferase, partial [Micromonosporaceae bacterium]|nr:SAM-dependent methyltransferase [Micromonosporaceae bacterium]
MVDADWSAADVDLTVPSAARIYDYTLGGSHNFEVDRMVAERIIEAVPDVPIIARANRSFLRRVVRFFADAGIRQFLDLGSGIPTVGNVHEVAQKAAPESRVVYVDADPVAVIHSKTMLAGNDQATAIQGDIRDVDRILTDPRVRSLIDFGQPVGVLALLVLHFISDEEQPEEIIHKLWETLCPGSYLAIS